MKKYVKPQVTDLILQAKGIIPLAEIVGVGAALAGGYVIGRVAKAVEVRVDIPDVNYLEKVVTNE